MFVRCFCTVFYDQGHPTNPNYRPCEMRNNSCPLAWQICMVYQCRASNAGIWHEFSCGVTARPTHIVTPLLMGFLKDEESLTSMTKRYENMKKMVLQNKYPCTKLPRLFTTYHTGQSTITKKKPQRQESCLTPLQEA